MTNSTPQSAVSASLAATETNVIIAGAEASLVGWVLYRTAIAQPLVPEPSEWHWFFTLYAIVGLLGIVIAGLALEGVAGLIERAITHRVFGSGRGTPRKWYVRWTKSPDSWAHAQQWIWTSGEAYQEFSRRRLRILVARNTALALLLLTIGWLSLAFFSLAQLSLVGSIVGLLGVGLFMWLWFDAQKGWNMAVTTAGEIVQNSRPTKHSTGRAKTARQ